MPFAITIVVYIVIPLIQVLAWWNVHRHNKMVDRRLRGMDERQNGRLDELIVAKEQIAYHRGRADLLAEQMTAKLATAGATMQTKGRI